MMKNTEMDMTSGNIAKKILLFALPLMISGWLQLSFNLADYIVCGQFVGQSAVGAIGATGSVSALMVDLFIGFDVGANVVMGNAYGARDSEKGNRVIGALTALSLTCGIFLAIIGVFCSKIFLTWMDTPSDIIDMSTSYMTIYFAGIPFLLLYNFGSSAMRGMGDTIRPFIFLTIGGVINVILNIIFVVPIKMGVAGLALATVISEAISALLVYIALLRNKGFAKFSFKNVRFYKTETAQIIRIGLPAGIQNAMFDIANVLIQSNINSFGTMVVSGDSAASRINGYVYNGMDAFAQAGVAFISANYGAGKKENVKKSLKWAIIYCLAIDIVLSALDVIFRKQLLGIIVSDEEAIQTGELNILITISTHFLMAIVDVVSSSERGIGYSTTPAIVSFVGICVLRIVYIYTIFNIPEFHNMAALYATYPISWAVTGIAHSVSAVIIFKKAFKKMDSKDKAIKAIS